jgi:hypothetical protein
VFIKVLCTIKIVRLSILLNGCKLGIYAVLCVPRHAVPETDFHRLQFKFNFIRTNMAVEFYRQLRTVSTQWRHIVSMVEFREGLKLKIDERLQP